jgi:hypothetical protein
MPATTIARPRPKTGPTRDEADRMLLRREGRFRNRWGTLAFLGFCVLWLGPALFATLGWIAQQRDGGSPTSWGTLFGWCAVIGVPLFLLLEYLTRGSYFESAVEELDDAITYSARNRSAGAAMLIEIGLWGPRMLIAGVTKLGGAARHKPAARRAAAALVAVLLRREDGMRSGDAMTEAQLNADDFGDALAYLTFHDIVGISKDGLRLWLLTDARKKLLA